MGPQNGPWDGGSSWRLASSHWRLLGLVHRFFLRTQELRRRKITCALLTIASVDVGADHSTFASKVERSGVECTADLVYLDLCKCSLKSAHEIARVQRIRSSVGWRKFEGAAGIALRCFSCALRAIGFSSRRQGRFRKACRWL